MERQEDFSGKVVLVLLIVAIVVSIFGTWAVLEYATTIGSSPRTEQPAMEYGRESQGKVALTIVQPQSNTAPSEEDDIEKQDNMEQ